VLALLGELTDFGAGLMLTVETGSVGSLAALPCLGADLISQDVYAAGMRIFLRPSLCARCGTCCLTQFCWTRVGL